MKIVIAPNTVLSQVAKPVEKIDKDVINLIEEMKTTLLFAKDPQGVGLAAPQVGKSLRIFIAKPTDKSPIGVYINPEIQTQNNAELETQKESEKISVAQRKDQLSSAASPTKLEGCLSLPNIWGIVKRDIVINFTYLDEAGKKHKKICKGFLATIVQHEMDHLNGILFPKRVLEQDGTLYKSYKNKKGQDEFDAIEI